MRHLLQILLHLGPAGSFLLGVADSSFLLLPFGNDLLLLVLIARNHSLAWQYVPAAATGSVAGIFLLDMVCRNAGEAGLLKMINQKRFDFLKKKISERAAYAVAVACLAPPPFPFTVVIAATSAFQYSRRKLLLIALVSRLLRFSIVAVLAILFGRHILVIVKSRPFFWAMIGFIAVCVIGSIRSVIIWLRWRRK